MATGVNFLNLKFLNFWGTRACRQRLGVARPRHVPIVPGPCRAAGCRRRAEMVGAATPDDASPRLMATAGS
jgi:hypothetical protein